MTTPVAPTVDSIHIHRAALPRLVCSPRLFLASNQRSRTRLWNKRSADATRSNRPAGIMSGRTGVMNQKLIPITGITVSSILSTTVIFPFSLTFDYTEDGISDIPELRLYDPAMNIIVGVQAKPFFSTCLFSVLVARPSPSRTRYLA